MILSEAQGGWQVGFGCFPYSDLSKRESSKYDQCLELSYFDGHIEGFNCMVTKRQAAFGAGSLSECWLVKIFESKFGVGIQVRLVGL